MINAKKENSFHGVRPFPRICIVIPARMGSTRFPNKPMELCGDKTLINTVHDKCKETGYDTYVLTESLKIAEHVEDLAVLVYSRLKIIRMEQVVVVQRQKPLLLLTVTSTIIILMFKVI